MSQAVLAGPGELLPADARAPRAVPGLSAFARLTCACAFTLLIAGGLVTSTGSGLAVPDWPLSFGQFFPPMIGGVLFEHGHRLIAGLVATLTFALAFWIRAKESRRPVRALAYGACGAILIQALLGGMTVLFKLPAPVSIAHACLGQAVFCMILAQAQMTSPWYLQARPQPIAPGLWKYGAASVATAFLQLFLGAVLRHTGLGLWLHIAWALPTSAVVLLSINRIFKNAPGVAPLTRPAALLALLLPAQLALGWTAYLIRRSVTFEIDFSQAAALTTAHVAVGALLLGTSLIWTLRAYRVKPS